MRETVQADFSDLVEKYIDNDNIESATHLTGFAADLIEKFSCEGNIFSRNKA